MYVCMYVCCMYVVCMYVCIYVYCMYVCMYVRTYMRTYIRTYVRMYGLQIKQTSIVRNEESFRFGSPSHETPQQKAHLPTRIWFLEVWVPQAGQHVRRIVTIWGSGREPQVWHIARSCLKHITVRVSTTYPEP